MPLTRRGSDFGVACRQQCGKVSLTCRQRGKGSQKGSARLFGCTARHGTLDSGLDRAIDDVLLQRNATTQALTWFLSVTSTSTSHGCSHNAHKMETYKGAHSSMKAGCVSCSPHRAIKNIRRTNPQQRFFNSKTSAHWCRCGRGRGCACDDVLQTVCCHFNVVFRQQKGI